MATKPKRPDGGTAPEDSPLVLGLLAGALVAFATGQTSVPLIFNALPVLPGFIYGSLIAFSAAVLATVAAPRLSRRARLLCMAVSLLAGAAALLGERWLVFSAGSGGAWAAVAVLVLAAVAQAAGFAFGVGIALDSRPAGARLAILFGAATSFSALLLVLGRMVAIQVNPDLADLTASITMIEAAAALAAAVALVRLLLGGNRRPVPKAAEASLARALTEIWGTRRARLALAGYLVQLCLVVALSTLGQVLASNGGAFANARGLQNWLLPASLIVGFFAGALLSDRRRREGRDATPIGVWGVVAGVLIYLFALNIEDASQAWAFISVGGGACALAWAPTYATVYDAVRPQDRPTAVAFAALLISQLTFIGLPAITGALAAKFAGAADWSLNTGFWGEAALHYQGSSTTSTFLLPIKISASLGDASATTATVRAAGMLLAIALAGPIILYRLAGRIPPPAPAAELEVERRRSPLPAGLIGLGVAAAVVVGAMFADAEGFLHKHWTAAIVWKPPQPASGVPAADEAIKACQDTACLFDVMKANHAPAETVAFMKMVQNELGNTMGYPVAFEGRGRVNVVEVFQPGLGMSGISEFVFVNGTKTVVLPAEDIEQTANGSADYRNFKAQYPQVTVWPGMAFVKETSLIDGSQRFEFALSLLNGCHACEYLGQLHVGYSFDAHGHYTGVSIVDVQPDKNAPYAALLGRLRDETTLDQTVSGQRSDGGLANVPFHTLLMEKSHCRMAVTVSTETFDGQDYNLEEAFNVRDVVLQTQATFPALNLQPDVIAFACRSGQPCATQDYSDARGHAPWLPSTAIRVPFQTMEAAIRDFRTLQAMCGG